MGQPTAQQPSVAVSTHTLRDLHHDSDAHPDGLPPSYDEITAGPSQVLPSASAGTDSTSPRAPDVPSAPTVRLIDVDCRIPGGQKPTTMSSRVRDCTIVTLNPELSNNAHELYTTIAQQIHIPPRPQLVITGTHSESSKNRDKKKNESNLVTDFNFRLDLAETLLTGWERAQSDSCVTWHNVDIARDCDGVKRYRGTRSKTVTWRPHNRKTGGQQASPIRLPEDDPESNRPYMNLGTSLGDYEEDQHPLVQPDTYDESAGHDRRFNTMADQEDFIEWCRRFCSDPSAVKSFTLKRHVRNFNHQEVIRCLKSHIRDTNYRGNIYMELVVAKETVTIYSPHWINKLRNHSAVFWICVILQLWIISWPVIWLLEKRYEIVDSCWYASHTVENGNGYTRSRKYARGRDERALGEFWAPAVKQAAWARRQNGEIVALEDAQRLQGLTTEQVLVTGLSDSQSEIERRQRMERGEGSFVDSVVGLARGVSEVRQGWNMTMGWGGNT